MSFETKEVKRYDKAIIEAIIKTQATSILGFYLISYGKLRTIE